MNVCHQIYMYVFTRQHDRSLLLESNVCGFKMYINRYKVHSYMFVITKDVLFSSRKH